MGLSFSDIISLLALVIAVLAFAQASSYRRRDHLIEVEKARAELDEQIASISQTIGEVRDELRFGGRPPMTLSMHEPTETLRELTRYSRELSELRALLAATPTVNGVLGRLRAEAALSSLVTVRAKATSLSKAVEAFRDNIISTKKSGRFLP